MYREVEVEFGLDYRLAGARATSSITTCRVAVSRVINPVAVRRLTKGVGMPRVTDWVIVSRVIDLVAMRCLTSIVSVSRHLNDHKGDGFSAGLSA